MRCGCRRPAPPGVFSVWAAGVFSDDEVTPGLFLEEPLESYFVVNEWNREGKKKNDKIKPLSFISVVAAAQLKAYLTLRPLPLLHCKKKQRVYANVLFIYLFILNPYLLFMNSFYWKSARFHGDALVLWRQAAAPQFSLTSGGLFFFFWVVWIFDLQENN